MGSLLCASITTAQQEDPLHANDSLDGEQNLILPDTLRGQDSLIIIDSLSGYKEDLAPAISPNALQYRVDFESIDSLHFDMKNHKVFMYNEATIDYDDINLKANYVEMDFNKTEIFASGIPDSTGMERGQPIFVQGESEFRSQTMRYNYESKKALIRNVTTQDGEGTIRGDVIKKMPNNEANIKGGSYSTCPSCENRDFEFRYFKSKVIPGKRIVTGPAYLVVEDVPTPLFLPFGFFPIRQGQSSGIILPTWGESTERGFYFEGGGYYWAINDYVDLKVVGDIYTGGSWAVKPSTRYKKRYKYSGAFEFLYAINIVGEEGQSDYRRDRDYQIRWKHQQDKKARPNSTFTANVNIRSRKSNYYNPTTAQDYLSNTFQSSVAYQTSFSGKYFLTLNANHSQNTKTKLMTITLPEVSFNVNRMYPFRKQNRSGRMKWWEDISVNYTANMKNTVTIADSLLFQSETVDQVQNGIKHSIPISSSVKLLKHFTWTNSINMNDRMYFKTIEKNWVDTVFSGNDTIPGYVREDTISGFRNAFDASFSSSITTKLYGMYQFGKRFPVQAIRHVITPKVSFTFTPDWGDPYWGYYKSYYDPNLEEDVEYSIFEGSVYGSPPRDKSGRVNFSLSNNLEMKVRSRKDTVTGTKKIKLIDNFTISTSYDVAKDSLNWSKLKLSGRTTLFKGFDIRYSSSWDPYILDSTGTHNLDQFEWNVNRRLLRLDQTDWNFSANLQLSPDMFKKKGGELEARKEELKETAEDLELSDELESIYNNYDDYIDWDIKWRLNLTYNLRYSTTLKYTNQVNKERQENLVQTLGLSGDFNITPKWKIGFRTGWDFEAADLSYTSINIYRDLHCFEMRFNWIPIGGRQSWNFALNVKANMLQDLKLQRKKDFRDY
ncbi:MAG: LPS-assembly protein LptD [Bacteroidales bacterium]|nr:LPS-assembly protein LptD [Bacteroidales bacterium]